MERRFGERTVDLTSDAILYAPPSEVAMVRDRQLAHQLAVLAVSSPHHRRQLAAAGLSAGDLTGADALPRIPLTSKADFLADPQSFRLDPRPSDPVEDRTLAYVLYTTGTTSGDPAPLFVTTSDDWAYLLHAQRCARMLGLSHDDVIANLFPLTPFPMGARIRADRTAAAVGASIFQGHTGHRNPDWPVHRRMDEAIDLVSDHRATVLWGVAGFIRRVLLRAAERGVTLPHVRWCFITGESTTADGMADLGERLMDVGASGARIANRYGSTEGWSLIACGGGHGWHNPTPELILLEAVDVATGAPVPDGEEGHLAITHLRGRGTAFLRYLVGDVVSMSRDTCGGCGRTAERLVTQPVRRGSLIKVNGTMVNLDVASAALARTAGLTEHRVVVEHRRPEDSSSGDQLTLEVAVAAGENRAEVAAAAVGHVRAAVHLTPAVRFCDADEIYDPLRDPKPRRTADRRLRPEPGGPA